MATISGDITEVTYQHPTLGGGSFSPKAGEGNSFDPGGLRNNDDSSMITADLQLMIQKNRVAGSFEILVANDMNIRNDAEKIKQLMESPELADWTVTVINGTVWRGQGVPVGDVAADVNAGTLPIKIVAPVFEKIAG